MHTAEAGTMGDLSVHERELKRQSNKSKGGILKRHPFG